MVEFSRINRVLDSDVYGRNAVVEPGLINLRLDEQVRQKNLYFPPDPASQRASTIGGNVSENSGGPHCFKYGVTTNYVTGMRVVLADGRAVQIGGRAMDYPAYDLCGLLTGSEGMLALFTSIFLRLVRTPPAVKTMLAAFDSVEQAGLAETLLEVNQVCEHYQLRVGYVFHAGDGNLHPMVLVPDKQDKDLMERVHAAGREMVELAVSKGGSLSGEHGVGIEKRQFMPLIYNQAELSAMLDVKHAFDPHNLLNPGKIFPLDTSPSAPVETGLAPTSTEQPLSASVPVEAALGPILVPTTVEEAAALLLSATRGQRHVRITGSSVREAQAGDTLIMSTSALKGIKTYAPDDLYVTVGAGTPFT